jgi:DMSO/TMAO reductase YedYZ molybdopterin-dependent catalytic subunit
MSAPYTSSTASPGPAPENRPAALAALLADVTPTAAHYRRNHFAYPRVNLDGWRLPVGGAVRSPYEVTLDDLRARPTTTHRVLLECAGHRRTDFQPPIGGVQWGLGALSQAEWSGPALGDILARAGVRDDAVEVVLHGADRGPFPELPGVHAFARSLPLAKALHPDTILALDMNGAPLTREHGAPVRAVVPGWYAMDSVKWLTGIEVVTEPFRGAFQELDYRFQAAGETGIGTRLDLMPPHALFVSVVDGDTVAGGHLELTGIAWAGAGVASVEIRVGAGPWEPAKITSSRDPYQRVVWRVVIDLPAGQPTTLAVRATDEAGTTQPNAPIWNKRGYANNSIQRVEVRVV